MRAGRQPVRRPLGAHPSPAMKLWTRVCISSLRRQRPACRRVPRSSASCGRGDSQTVEDAAGDGREPGAGPRVAARGAREPEPEGGTGTGLGPEAARAEHGRRKDKARGEGMMEQHEERCMGIPVILYITRLLSGASAPVRMLERVPGDALVDQLGRQLARQDVCLVHAQPVVALGRKRRAHRAADRGYQRLEARSRRVLGSHGRPACASPKRAETPPPPVGSGSAESDC